MSVQQGSPRCCFACGRRPDRTLAWDLPQPPRRCGVCPSPPRLSAECAAGRCGLTVESAQPALPWGAARVPRGALRGCWELQRDRQRASCDGPHRPSRGRASERPPGLHRQSAAVWKCGRGRTTSGRSRPQPACHPPSRRVGGPRAPRRGMRLRHAACGGCPPTGSFLAQSRTARTRTPACAAVTLGFRCAPAPWLRSASAFRPAEARAKGEKRMENRVAVRRPRSRRAWSKASAEGTAAPSPTRCHASFGLPRMRDGPLSAGTQQPANPRAGLACGRSAPATVAHAPPCGSWAGGGTSKPGAQTLGFQQRREPGLPVARGRDSPIHARAA